MTGHVSSRNASPPTTNAYTTANAETSVEVATPGCHAFADHRDHHERNERAADQPQHGSPFGERRGRIDLLADVDRDASQREREDECRNDAGHEQPADRDVGDEAEDDHVDARRDGLGHHRRACQQAGGLVGILLGPADGGHDDAADGRDVGQLGAGHAGEERGRDDDDQIEPAPQAPHHAQQQLDQPRRHAVGLHRQAGQHEERYGEQDEMVGAGDDLLRIHQHGSVGLARKYTSGGEREREGDRHADHDAADEADDQQQDRRNGVVGNSVFQAATATADADDRRERSPDDAAGCASALNIAKPNIARLPMITGVRTIHCGKPIGVVWPCVSSHRSTVETRSSGRPRPRSTIHTESAPRASSPGKVRGIRRCRRAFAGRPRLPRRGTSASPSGAGDLLCPVERLVQEVPP